MTFWPTVPRRVNPRSILYFAGLLAALSFVSACQPSSTGNVRTADSPHSIIVSIPKNAPSIGSDYGAKWSVSGRSVRGVPHNGIDIVASSGHPIIAPLDGKVSTVQYTHNNGLIIFINHGEAAGLNPFTTGYYHLDEATVKEGDFVTRGHQIGTIGRSGETSGGVSHLHFMVNNGHANPHWYWIGGRGKIVCFDRNASYSPKGDAVLTYPVACAE